MSNNVVASLVPTIVGAIRALFVMVGMVMSQTAAPGPETPLRRPRSSTATELHAKTQQPPVDQSTGGCFTP